ncbi:MAG TPA: hypothetical protein VK922_08320 [Gemmatimonadaceae bacterium]|nr:hypothetical protein [Gemmatimonadaceae bacterium]
MGRALTSQRSVVLGAERETFLDRLRARRAYYMQVGCNYWVFEERDMPGAFVEFIEAPDARRLRDALGKAPERGPGSARIYEEVEF